MLPVAEHEDSISLEPVTEVARFYTGAACRTKKPRAAMLVTWAFPDTCVVSAATANGSLCRRDLARLCRLLYVRGCTTIEAWRRKGHLLPWGKIVARGKTHDTWRIDLTADIDTIDPPKGP